MRVFMTLSPVFVVLAIYWDSALLFFPSPWHTVVSDAQGIVSA
jgi:hypothetical protein